MPKKKKTNPILEEWENNLGNVTDDFTRIDLELRNPFEDKVCPYNVADTKRYIHGRCPKIETFCDNLKKFLTEKLNFVKASVNPISIDISTIGEVIRFKEIKSNYSVATFGDETSNFYLIKDSEFIISVINYLIQCKESDFNEITPLIQYIEDFYNYDVFLPSINLAFSDLFNKQLNMFSYKSYSTDFVLMGEEVITASFEIEIPKYKPSIIEFMFPLSLMRKYRLYPISNLYIYNTTYEQSKLKELGKELPVTLNIVASLESSLQDIKDVISVGHILSLPKTMELKVNNKVVGIVNPVDITNDENSSKLRVDDIIEEKEKEEKVMLIENLQSTQKVQLDFSLKTLLNDYEPLTNYILSRLPLYLLQYLNFNTPIKTSISFADRPINSIVSYFIFKIKDMIKEENK